MRILLAEDDIAIAALVCGQLETAGYLADIVADGPEIWERGETGDYAAIILDLGLPGMDGLSILKRWRKAGVETPVLVLTARGSWMERVDGFDAGADDYLPKPFDPRELLLRIRALLRRAAPPPATEAVFGPLALGALHFDRTRGELRGPAGVVRLTGGEAALLAALAARPNEVLTREDLAAVLEMDEAGERAIDVQVTRLRRKIETDPREPRFLHTVRGRGYVLKPGY